MIRSRALAAVLFAMCAVFPRSAEAQEHSEVKPSDSSAAALHPSRASGSSMFGKLDSVNAPRLRVIHRQKPVFIVICLVVLAVIVLLIVLYTIRHYVFTINRLFGTQRHPYTDVIMADWPEVTVLIAAHNEELVIRHILDALLDVDYPRERLRLIPVNDRSVDRTREIIDEYAAKHPSLIFPFHRTEGKAGKAAALKDATERVSTEALLVFDADYIPGRELIKQLVAPFFDPEVGAVMGRVIPLNSERNLLTRMLGLERSGGYQVDQQARMNLRLVPQYGGTVGGVRLRALREIGGWRDDTLTEDTDVTYRLLLAGWVTVYQNRSECYEEVPESWPVRITQIKRWARGHNQALREYLIPVTTSTVPGGMMQRIDAIMLLGIYIMAPMIGLGWGIALLLFYLGYNPYQGLVVLLAVSSYSSLGNFAAFFEIAAATRLDGSRGRSRLLPLLLIGFLVSLTSVSRALLRPKLFRRKGALVWDKTKRYRKEAA
jgi:cellulose synthase/poly-beta-1,6-N-acetylglucosamine synthase-like glycosyltransferase